MKTKTDFKAGTTLLFKDPKTGNFHTRFMISGKAYLLSTKVRDEKTAREVAYKLYVERFKGPVVIQDRVQRASLPTCRELVDVFLGEIVEFSGQKIKLASAKTYVNAFARLVSAVFEDWESESIDNIGLDCVSARRRALYAAKCLDISKDKDLVLNHSINSDLANALSVFSATALALYKTKGWDLKDIVAVLKDVRPLPARKPDFEPIPADVDARMIAAAAAALGDKCATVDKAAYPTKQVAVIFELARFCSLTCSEIQNIRWNWIDAALGRITIAGGRDFETKRNSKDRQIPVAPERVGRWKAALKGKSGDYVINDPILTKRLDITARDANAWIKSFFTERRHKGLHELRKMAASDFLRATNGDVFKVAKIIGDDPRTMLKYYAAVLDMDVAAL